ncbi:MAG: phage baseplate assembly protein V [Nostocaceae cyanobacterium]|nr:phage baseplate assembly protein V [Nostocaceae cyanobacterium]
MNSYYAPDFLVKIQGLTLEADVTQAVISLTCELSLEKASMFKLQLNNAKLNFTDSALFDVGKNVEIYMGYAGDLQPIMLGEITAVNPTFPSNGASVMTVTGYDKSHRMRHNQPSRFTFKNINDSAIAALIAAENLLIPIVDPSLMPPRESVQQTGSDWALLKELADRNFFRVYVHWDKLYFHFPRPQTELVVLEWGKNLISFNPRLSTAGQAGIQIIRGYDYKLAQKIVAILPAVAIGSDLDDLIERLGSTFLEQLVQLGRHVVRDHPVDSYIDAAVLAKSVLLQLLQGLYEGSGRCIGIPTLRPGQMIEIRGIGKRFGGSYTLSTVTHTIDDSGYQTQFEISQEVPNNLLQSLRKKIGETPSPNKQEKVDGVVIGIVENNLDPLGMSRVQLSFPHLSDVNLSNWARLATLMTGGDRGTYFLPDIGDEVAVVFEGGNIDKPIVIGSLWNGKARPPQVNKGLNEKKEIKTKSGIKILFDETPGKENLTLQTKTGSTIKIDDTPGAEKLSLQWKGIDSNLIELKQDGITIKFNNNSINLSSQGITIKIDDNNSMQISSAGVNIKGTQVELNANSNINMQASQVNVS